MEEEELDWASERVEWKRVVGLSMAKDRGGWQRTVYDWVHPWPSRLRRK